MISRRGPADTGASEQRSAQWCDFSAQVACPSSGSSLMEEVMPRGSDPAPPRVETPAGLREMAVRARRLAWGMPDEVTVARLSAFAAELEARAAALSGGCHHGMISFR